MFTAPFGFFGPRAGIEIEISSDATNLNLFDLVIAAGWNQISLTSITITINSGVTIGSTSPSTPSIIIRLHFPDPSLIRSFVLINNGAIHGARNSGSTVSSTNTFSLRK